MTREAALLSSSLTRSQVPLYLQLATVMRQRIAAGRWRSGQRLPTLQELVREFGVSRVTVREAVGTLEDEGLIWRKQGKGTFVAKQAKKRRWLNLQTDWSSLTSIIEGTVTRLLDVREVDRPPRIEASDGLAAPAYTCLRRVHSHDGAPYALIDIYLDRRLFRRAPEVFKHQMVLPALETMPGVEIATAWQTLVIGTADLEAADLLEIPLNVPVAEIRRVVVDRTGTVVYLGEVVYRGDFVRLDINLKR